MIDIADIKDNTPLKIIIGAGSQSWESWIPTQAEDLNLLKEVDWAQSFQKRKIDALLCEHVWEHLNVEEALEAAKRCFRYLNTLLERCASIANPNTLHHYIWGGLNYQFIADYIEKRNLSKKCGDLRFIVTQEKECCLILSFKVRTPLDHTCLPKSQQMNILPANAYRTRTYTYRSHIICAV
jgi:hypothetical protein